MADFKWHPDEPPPSIEEHSKAKLTVLRAYLRAYFDRLNVNPSRDEFKLDLIDGFSGGGVFRDENDIMSGTPLIMLEETEGARDRLNRKRAKPLRLDCKYYFIDVEAAHTNHLRKVLDERGYRVDEEKIVIRNSRFEDAAGDIIAEVRRRQPRAGRSIFLLDQTGFSLVELTLVAQIFRELSAAEVILTFAADALINHLAATPAFITAVAPLQLTSAQIHGLIADKEGVGGRALVQRTLRDHIRTVTGAAYDTPFFIRPRISHRALWFLHLSTHPIARDVMIQRHWDISNTFEHYGHGDFRMLGWDSLKNSETPPLFNFRELDEQRMQKQLLNDMPQKLFSLTSEEPISVDAMRRELANQTAARFSDLDKVVLELFQEKEIDILRPDGKVRSRTLKRLSPLDRIALPATLMLPGFSRRR